MKYFVLGLTLLLAGCATTQSDFTPIGEIQAAKPADHKIDIFTEDSLPDRSYEEIAILDVHMETSGFVSRSFDEAEPKLKEQARAAGGDAIIAIKEQKTSYLENQMYHVTAKAIKYTD